MEKPAKDEVDGRNSLKIDHLNSHVTSKFSLSEELTDVLEVEEPDQETERLSEAH
jgi:hypothetical protein